MNIHEIVKKLAGNIDPIWVSQTEAIRYENLIELTSLVDMLLTDIDDVATDNKDRVESSRKEAGKYADKFLTRMGIEP